MFLRQTRRRKDGKTHVICVPNNTLVPNRIRGLLASQGVAGYDPLRRDRGARLEILRTGDGGPLPERDPESASNGDPHQWLRSGRPRTIRGPRASGSAFEGLEDQQHDARRQAGGADDGDQARLDAEFPTAPRAG
jgi:hypothetical protein